MQLGTRGIGSMIDRQSSRWMHVYPYARAHTHTHLNKEEVSYFQVPTSIAGTALNTLSTIIQEAGTLTLFLRNGSTIARSTNCINNGIVMHMNFLN